jgi:putative Mn2+ efflux pump MntP
MVNGQSIVRIVGYVTASAVFIVGIGILTGALLPAYVPSVYRLIAGVMMVLYGVYRVGMILLKQRNDKRWEE